MIRINLENLSENEIRYLAQEELENVNSLSVNEIIDLLKEKNGQTEIYEFPGTSMHKYLNSLSSTVTRLEELPGVKPVLESYNETSLHLVQRSLNWAYAYWNISDFVLNDLDGKTYSLFLKVSSYNPSEKRITNFNSFLDKSVPSPISESDKILDSYEIYIDVNDRNWNIQLPWADRRYEVSLELEINNQINTLCTSNVIESFNSEIKKNPEILNNPNTYTILINPLLSKTGNIIKNTHIMELLIPPEVKNEEQD